MKSALRHTLIAAVFTVLFAFTLLPATIASEIELPSKSGAALPTGAPVLDAAGNQLYGFFLDERAVKTADVTGVPRPRLAADPRNVEDWRGWHAQGAQALLRDIEADYGIQAVSMTSWLVPTFSTYVPAELADRLVNDTRIDRVYPIHDTLEFSA